MPELPEFDWPTCPKCGRPVVVTRGGEEGNETWFTFCCWDGPTRKSPWEALDAFLQERDFYKGHFDLWCGKCRAGVDQYNYDNQLLVAYDAQEHPLCPVCDHRLIQFCER